ncbi:hypothetical protein IGI04_031484 [Brassica rapa subsp. trilocularis]|uniref:Zinc knuckle CX2CX4HX4C domain-containing protein n=1 Tax=Brassica rapa subsp. trilocularis TaxID=1813537 RepID=A0ABQ7LTP7_BRACM|nr:hypothetical protein IGI04_031484 [Brassica rapa subsp. trilocularis]
MFFYRWDPGIVGDVGQGIEFHYGKNKGILRWGSLSNLRGSDVGLGEWIQGILRKLGICASWIWILLINTMESYDYTGHISEVLNTRILICFKEIGGIIYGSEMEGNWCFLIYCGFDNIFFWKIGDLRFNQGITVAIFGINGGKYGRGEMENWIKYKKSWGSPLCCITLLNALGRTVSVDLDNSRVQVVVNAFQQLCFETTVDFKGGEFYEGEEVAISLRYEKLFGFCPICSSLCHKEEKCPLAKPEVKTSPARKRETGAGNGGWFEVGKHDDRARSYKGVVINGNQSHQHRERDHRDYYGKGKGKVVEENDSKWVKVAEKGNKGAFHNRGNYRGDGDGSRQRTSRREEPRMTGQDGRLKAAVGHTGDQRSQRGSRVEAQEEGEITNAEGTDKHLPSQNFQEELARTQATGTEVVSDPMDAENGLQMVQSLVENTTALEEDRVMDMDEIKAVFLEHGIDMDAADDLQDGSDGEFEKAVLELEQENGENVHAEEELATGEEEKLMEDGELAKRQGTRKRLFKTTIGTAASTKLRSASAMVSPRKRGASKPGTRHGEMGKQMEIKGTSNPKTGPQKP